LRIYEEDNSGRRIRLIYDMQLDITIASPSVMSKLAEPATTVNAAHFSQIRLSPGSGHAVFLKRKQREYSKDVNIFSAAADPLAIEAVTNSQDLCKEAYPALPRIFPEGPCRARKA